MSSEDRAQEQELAEWERLQKRAASRVSIVYKPSEIGYGTADCRECGDQMPAERRAMGQTLCTQCQSSEERHNKQYGR